MTQEELDALIAATAAQLDARIGAVLARLHVALSEEDVARMIEDGTLLQELDRRSAAAAEQIAAAWQAAYLSAAQAVADYAREAGDAIVVLDATNWRAVERMAANRLELVQALTAEQRAVVGEILTEATLNGINPREAARQVRDVIGLAPNQARAVTNYRRYLETLDRRALERQLRDRRFDRTVDRAIREGRPLTPEQIDRMVARYAERMLTYRAETISRRETLLAVHQAEEDAFDAAIAAGELDPSALSCQWWTALDERVRPTTVAQARFADHRAMHGQVRRWGEHFVSGAGNRLLYPHDPDAPAAETIGCRCTRLVTIDAGRDLGSFLQSSGLSP